MTGDVSPHGYSDAYGPNVANILASATRVIRGTVPRAVRNELMAAVKAGVLGRLKKDGLKPEIFYHPNHKHGAVERQKREALYSVKCISTVVVGDKEKFRNAMDSSIADLERRGL